MRISSGVHSIHRFLYMSSTLARPARRFGTASVSLAEEYVRTGDAEDAHPYGRFIYERMISSATAGLVDRSAAVAERLVASLLCGPAIGRQHLPFHGQ
jgi:hypothetical protein